jgi:hypothetical protein
VKIATVISAHAFPEIVKDTIDAVKFNMTDKILVVVDKAGWKIFENEDMNKICGLYHNHHCSNYKNYIFGIKSLYEMYPDCDWYCWLEYDVLITSPWFKRDLELAHKKGVWMLGCDLREYPFEFTLLQNILKEGTIKTSRYLLGCCHFIHRDFLDKLYPTGFFDRFAEATKKFEQGYFPNYERYAFEEEVLPTIVHHFDGKIQELSCWNEDNNEWRGSSMYPVRFRPEIDPGELSATASIIHPVKELKHPIRVHYRKIRSR